MTFERWLCRHPLLGYFALAYGISWGGTLIVLGVSGFELTELRPLDTGFIFVSMLLGPSMAGLAMTARLDGRAGLRELRDLRQNFGTVGIAWVLEFAVFYVGALTAYRLLMTWVHANTGSLLLAVLMHASYTGWLFVLYPATSFEQGLVWQLALAAGLWVAVVVAFRHRGLAPKGCA